MKTKFVLIALSLMLLGCNDQPPPQTAMAPKIATAPPKPAHHYVMQDGMQYGYPVAISELNRQGGQAAPQLVMVYYAGERGGKYQAHIMDGQVVSAIECAKPCEYAKIMTYIDDPYLRDQIKVERLKAEPFSIVYLIMDDATNGRFKTYGREINGKRYTAWMDEKKGMRFTPIK